MRVEGLHQVALHVEDMDRAEAFYRDVLGLREIARFDPPGLLFFDLGNVRLLLEGGAPSSLLYLAVADIDEAWAELEGKGVTLEAGPHVIHRDDAGQFGPAGAEVWMAFFRDSEGNLLGLEETRLTPA
jgi:catechol 2,3-dioxygenase-like lactoylglutathione lyase family enzyme